MLFDPSKHEELSDKVWTESIVKEVINSIFEDTLSQYNPKSYWPTSADEDADVDINKSIYYGAAGTILALEKISKYLNKDLPFNSSTVMEKVHKDYLEVPDTKEVVPSIFLGEVGILLFQHKLSPTIDLEDRIYNLVEANIENETLEALWGAPGTMIAAFFIYEKTKEERWKNLFLKNSNFLIKKLKEEELKGEILWEQNMYGKLRRFVGAGHGYFGNIFGILKGIDLLSKNDSDYILEHVKKVIKVVAIEDDGMMNFATLNPTNPEIKQFTQWCHGAPGIITSLHNYPADNYVDQCLLKSGELVWRAGPLKKGTALCHGTDGNGYAFLQLYKRTGDSMWLKRARSFGMHALSQRNGRFSLFTGELGLAYYLIDCLEGNDDLPILDSL